MAAYDQVGRTYTQTRRAAPRIPAQIDAALRDAASVVALAAPHDRPPGQAHVARPTEGHLPPDGRPWQPVSQGRRTLPHCIVDRRGDVQ
jgi:hypothetical protein